ncbi:hypothetical protein G6F42_011051 [Rhizopus arrhizus]|nr:hypothetical protein G6F42_011051 [Rhizopus arrhizus]
MKLRNKSGHTAIVFRREKQREDMIKLETIHWQRNLSQKSSSTASNGIAINLKKEDSKDYNSVDNIKHIDMEPNVY